MLSKKGKLIFAIVSVLSALACIGLIYIGFNFFAEKKLILWVYNIYILGLAGVVLFMVHRYLKAYIP